MSQCKIHLENYSGIYYAGSEIRGRLECFFNENTTFRGIKIRIKCKEYNEWTGTETYTDPVDNKSKTRYITLTGDHDVIYVEQMLLGSAHGTQSLGRGRHVYPFSYTLPYDIPSTFNGPHGSITYKIEGIVDKPMSFDYEDSFIFIVQSPIDFNQMSRDMQTVTTYSDEKTVCCWCCAGGNVTMDVELPKIAFTPGEVIPFKVALCNLSNSNVDALKGKLTKTIKYRVTSPQSESKEDVEDILSFHEHGVGAHGEHTYELELCIPGDLEVPNFSKCDLFSVSYNLQVTSEMPACTLDLDVSVWDITIGHVQCPVESGNNHQEYSPPPFVPSGEGYGPPPPAGGFVPPPGYGPPPPAGGFIPPPGFAGGFVPPPGAPDYSPPPYPSAPSSSNPNAPMAPHDDNPKAREAAGGPSAPAVTPDLPPPSYTQAQQNAANPAYSKF